MVFSGHIHLFCERKTAIKRGSLPHHESMKNPFFYWVIKQRIPLLISFGFGFLASVYYCTAGYVSNEGPLQAWYGIYFVSWPASMVAIRILDQFDDYISGELSDFLYVAGVIAAGMLWFFLIAFVAKYVFRRRRPLLNK
jgi:hypothetical protein